MAIMNQPEQTSFSDAVVPAAREPAFPGAFRPTSLESIVDLMHKGHRSVYPIAEKLTAGKMQEAGLEPGQESMYPWGVVGTFGRYRYGVHADGRLVVLFSEEQEALKPVPHEGALAAAEPVFSLDRNRLSAVFAIAARAGHSADPWIIKSIQQHEADLRDRLLHAGLLCRVDEHTWVSRHIVYVFEDIPAEKKDELREKFGWNDEDERHCLRCYTSDGRGGTPVEAGYNGIFQKIFGLGPKPVYVTRAEGERIVSDDFARRVKLVIAGRDPYEYGLNGSARIVGGGENGVLAHQGEGILHEAYHFLKCKSLRFVHSIEPKVRQIKGKIWAAEAAKGGSVAIIQFMIKGTWGAVAYIAGYALSLANLIVNPFEGKEKRSGPDIVDTFWEPDEDSFIPENGHDRHYARIEAEQAAYTRLVARSEAHVRLPHQHGEAAMPEDREWAMEYILGTMKGPPGSVAALYDLNDHDVLAVNQTNGLRVYYIPDLNLVYAQSRPELARADAGELPFHVRDLLAEGPVIKVWEDNAGKLHCQAFDEAGFIADIGTETAVPPRRQYRIEPKIARPAPQAAPQGMEDAPYAGILAGSGWVLSREMNEASRNAQPVRLASSLRGSQPQHVPH